MANRPGQIRSLCAWAILAAAAIILILAAGAWAQTPATILSRVETGLEEAVQWKWKVESSGLAAHGAPAAAASPGTTAQPPERMGTETADTYTVKKGDVLFRIARLHKITVEQLKAANDLKSDMIHPGDVLRIPSPMETAAPAPPSSAPAASASASSGTATTDFDAEVLLLQVYLDRLGFSPGPIDGLPGLRFQKLMFTYLSAEGGDPPSLAEKARAELPQAFTTYTLRPSDFDFIRAPKPAARVSKKAGPEEKARQAYLELISQPELLYRSAWEFVAERFHCEESFLRKLNPSLKNNPEAGAVFRVPNVIPFEIENALAPPLRPEPDPEKPVKAVIADLSRLEIFEGDRMVASFPVSVARPGLRGRGEWVILGSMPWPRLLTRREPRVERTFSGEDGQQARPAVLASEEVIGPGPRNPV
ncbi:MAG: LysM peptidoglycan-binding domain-containing protein, partial [Terrimicrobiaceae bacterium]|nr:LysM peptidoglycan-binding domain-containing protein [Terrimicrobiaceae bacterium]